MILNKLILTCFVTVLLVSGIQARETIRIVRGQDFPPYHYLKDGNQETGFVIDTINAVAGRLGIDVIYQQYPWSRCINIIQKGHADAMMNLVATDRRREFMIFAQNIIAHETNALFHLVSDPVEYHGDLDALKKYRIGVIRNYSYGDRFDAVVFPKKFMMETENRLIDSLINRRCDLFIANKLVTRILLRDRKLDDRIAALSPDVSRIPLYIGFSKIKGHQELAKDFSTHLKQLKSTDQYRDILTAYGLTDR